MLEIFIDTANIEAIKRFCEMGVIDGVTTNPTLIAREGMDLEEAIEKILRIVDGPVSVEAMNMKAKDIIVEARQLANMAPNVVVKVPIMPEGLKAVSVLSKEGVKTNVTLAFSANQAILAAKAGATYVSPFIGRIDDGGHYGVKVVQDIVQIFKLYTIPTKVIAASIRHPAHVREVAKAGAHVITIPPPVLEMMIQHPLTDIGLQRFMEDWEKVKGL